jgi:MraZ protein
MLLTGAFARSLDEKQRVAIPKNLRLALLADGQDELFLTPGTDGSLAAYNEESFRNLALRLEKSPPGQEEVRAFSRLFYSQAQRVEVDAQGRIRIPPELCKLAGLDREVVVLGVGNRLEIWDRGRWEAYLESRSARYDEIAAAALGKSVEAT